MAAAETTAEAATMTAAAAAASIDAVAEPTASPVPKASTDKIVVDFFTTRSFHVESFQSWKALVI